MLISAIQSPPADGTCAGWLICQDPIITGFPPHTRLHVAEAKTGRVLRARMAQTALSASDWVAKEVTFLSKEEVVLLQTSEIGLFAGSDFTKIPFGSPTWEVFRYIACPLRGAYGASCWFQRMQGLSFYYSDWRPPNSDGLHIIAMACNQIAMGNGLQPNRNVCKHTPGSKSPEGVGYGLHLCKGPFTVILHVVSICAIYII